MNTYADKKQDATSPPTAATAQLPSAFLLADKRPEAITQRKAIEAIASSRRVMQLQAQNAAITSASLAKQATTPASISTSNQVIQLVKAGLRIGTMVRIKNGQYKDREARIESELPMGRGYRLQGFARAFPLTDLDEVAAPTESSAASASRVPPGKKIEAPDTMTREQERKDPEVVAHEVEATASGPGTLIGSATRVLSELSSTVKVEADSEGRAQQAAKIRGWDQKKPHHFSADKALAPFKEQWQSDNVPHSLGKHKGTEEELKAAIKEMEEKQRYFSHDMNPDYIPFAIAQKGIQSGYNTSLALGKTPKRDSGKAQNHFVFTRQLPPKGVKSQVSDGQVGATEGAMIVFRPSMFEEKSKLAFFKGFDGGFRSHVVPTSAYKGAHLAASSQAADKNSDKHFHQNQEQAVLGDVSLKHIAIIVLKVPLGKVEPTSAEGIKILRAHKAAFLEKLKALRVADELPPAAARERISKASDIVGAYDTWKAEQGKLSLYDLLQQETGRKPEGIIKAVSTQRTRHSIRKLAHDTLSAEEHASTELSASTTGSGKEEVASTASGQTHQPGELEKSSTSTSSTHEAPVDAWARRLGGTADYGSSNMNNCLIYAIANVLDVEAPAEKVDAIRKALQRAFPNVVDERDFLPAYGRIVELIMQHLMAEAYEQGRQLPTVTVQIDTVEQGVDSVIVGTGPRVHIFHDGGHFWALRR